MAPKVSAETADRLQRAAVAKNEVSCLTHSRFSLSVLMMYRFIATILHHNITCIPNNTSIIIFLYPHYCHCFPVPPSLSLSSLPVSFCPCLQLVSQYLHLGANLKRCSAAVEAYAHALNEANDTKEIIDLLKAPLSAPMPTGMPEYLPFLHAASSAAAQGEAIDSNTNKRSKSADESDVEVDANGKKKRKKLAKKLKDPDAPRRPPSAYIIFQNEVREKVKHANPGVPYSEILQQISEQWKALGDEKQRTFKDKADAAMATWRETAAEYTKNKEDDATTAAALNGNNDSMAVDPMEAAAIQAALTAKPKKEKKAPTSKKESASKAAAAAAPTAPAAAAPESAPLKKESKKDTKPKSAAAAATTSTPAAKNVALPKPASPVKPTAVAPPAKKNIPQTTQDSSDSDTDTSEESSSESDSD